MQTIDWIVLVATLAFIVLFGVYKTRGRNNVQDYIRGGNENIRACSLITDFKISVIW